METVGIQRDSTLAFDVAGCVKLLNSVCSSISFVELPVYRISGRPRGCLRYKKETLRTRRLLGKHRVDFVAYFTRRRYPKGYYTDGSRQDLIASLADWEHYTALPVENGVLFFLAGAIAESLSEKLKHDQSTGCVYDLLYQDKAVDRCLKMGMFCDDCRATLAQITRDDSSRKDIYEDVVDILNLLANTSRWGKSVLWALDHKDLSQLTTERFVSEVADYYRRLGAKVNRHVDIAGFQVDLLVTETTSSGEDVRSAIECKLDQHKVGSRTVSSFAQMMETVKESHAADKGVIVASSGFTQDAFLHAKRTGTRLLQYEDIVDAETRPSSAATKQGSRPAKGDGHGRGGQPEVRDRSVFVLMPFSSRKLNDLFYRGMHPAIRKAGGTCARADELHYTGSILAEIYARIGSARLIVAEVSRHNANVFYELGYAHALSKPVVLLTSDISKTPFDTHGFNHIIYKDVGDLRRKLTARLKVLLQDLRGDDRKAQA